MIPFALLLATLAPAFRVDVPYPTKDKPQSKLWFDHRTWWAWLPTSDGSSIWRRTSEGWQRQVHLDSALRGLPGQADVWAANGEVRAVLAGNGELATAALRWSNGRYMLDGPPTRWKFSDPPPETATITRARDGRWWIAYDHGPRIFARASLDPTGTRWDEPIQINERDTAPDDICAIVTLPEGPGVIWSDQASDAVYFRLIGREIETVAQGGLTADDHINAAVTPDGTLYAAMKNSVDEAGQPQLVLRIRNRHGWWTSLSYAPRTADGEPSRPIVLTTGEPARVFLVHTFYERKPAAERRDYIAAFAGNPARLLLDFPFQAIARVADRRLNDATGPKAALPPDAPWIVLSSSQDGAVYESNLRNLIGNASHPSSAP
jgi:hypothetical protein